MCEVGLFGVIVCEVGLSVTVFLLPSSPTHVC